MCTIQCIVLIVLQMYTLQELCLDCTGANAGHFEVCDFEGVCYSKVNTH